LNKKTLVKIGIVGRPKGLGGSFYVSGRNDPWDQHFKKVMIGDSPDHTTSHVIKHQTEQSGRTVIATDLVNDRTQAELLNGKGIWVQSSQLTVDHDEEYLWQDIEGRKVYDNMGALVGRVETVQNFGASDFVTIQNSQGQHASLPFVDVYFDMAFTPQDDRLNLIVSEDILQELWQ
jgi:16S rRNA processing protein RimM